MAENIPGVSYPLATTGEVFAGLSNSKSVTPFGLSTVTGVLQRFDNQLAAVAALGPTGNQLVMFTGSGPDGAYLFPFSSVGQTLASGNAGTLSGLLSYPSFSGRGPVELWRSGQVYSYGYGSGSLVNAGLAVHRARDASVSGDKIFVYTNALVTGNLAKNYVDWWFAPGTTITATGASIFNDNSGQLVTSIGGFGNFQQSGGYDLVAIYHNNSEFNIIAEKLSRIDSNSFSVIYQAAGRVFANVQEISGSYGNGLYWENGPMYVQANRIRCNSIGGFPIYAALKQVGNTPTGDMYVKAQEIINNGTVIGCYGSGNVASEYRVWIDANQIISSSGNQSVSFGNGKLYINAQKIIGDMNIAGLSLNDKFYLRTEKVSFSTFSLGGGTNYLNITEVDDAGVNNSFSELFTINGGIHNLDIMSVNRTTAGGIFACSNGTGNILNANTSVLNTYYSLKQTSNGVLRVGPSVIYNPVQTTGTISYLGSSGLLNSLKTVDGSGSGLDTDLVRGVTGQFPATNLIALVPTGNQIPWFPTNATTGLLPLSSFGQSLLSGDAATATGLLGLGASTPIDSGAFQPSNSTLTGVANLTPTGNQFFAYRESGTPTLESLTNFGMNLVGSTGLSNGTRTNRVLFSSGSGTPYSTDNVFYDGAIFTLDNTNGFKVTYGNATRVIIDDDSIAGSRILLYNNNSSIQHFIASSGVQLNNSTGNVRFTVHGSGQRNLFSVKPQGNTVHVGTSGGTAKFNIMGGSANYALDLIHPTLQNTRIRAYSNGSNGRMELYFQENTASSHGAYISYADSYFCNTKTYGPGNFGIGANPTGNGGVSTLVLGQATAPTANVANTVTMWCADRSGGNGLGSLFLKAENGTTHLFGDRVGITNTNPLSTFDISGSLGAAIQVLTTGNSPYTPSGSDYTLLCNCLSGNIIVRLPASTGVTRRIYNIKKIDSTVSTVTISGNANELIDGSVSQTISGQWERLSMQAFSTGWYII